ncbi:hypothetical protein [Geobacillus jurassicus]|uniref:hypothetical protein n=1 Tax=Geobacillus jurassicus TaxID=235932 RepID=UPI003634E924
MAAVKAHLIVRYGVEAFDRAIVIREVIGWAITLLCILGFARITNILYKQSGPDQASG